MSKRNKKKGKRKIEREENTLSKKQRKAILEEVFSKTADHSEEMIDQALHRLKAPVTDDEVKATLQGADEQWEQDHGTIFSMASKEQRERLRAQIEVVMCLARRDLRRAW